ncbi:hypothetical protein B0H13DRAFT_199951 [Mycena leptocephala]|nr:hypothetical protein B0H13DRAFT_199951 [Mycena leptocephala]
MMLISLFVLTLPLKSTRTRTAVYKESEPILCTTHLYPTIQIMADTSSAALLNRRRRAMIACTNCRRRKIKCVTTEEPPRHPCARCTKRSLSCEYVAVDEDYPTTPTTPEHAGSQLPSPPYPNGAPRYTTPGVPPSGYSTYPPQQHVPWNPSAPSQPAYPAYLGHPTYTPSHTYAPGHNPYGPPQGYPPQYGFSSQFSAPPPNQWAQGSIPQQPR